MSSRSGEASYELLYSVYLYLYLPIHRRHLAAARVESSEADARICVRESPLFLPPLLFPTEVGSPLNQLGGLVERGKLPSRVRSKTNLVHSEAVRKLLAAIILSILKCMFYSTLCLRKKQDTKLVPITSPNVNRFSKFFHW